MKAAWLACLLALAPAAAIAAPSFVIEGHPVAGQPITVTLTDGETFVGGTPVQAVYRMNAHDSLLHTQDVGVTDAAGRVEWVPEEAGVVVLKWDGGSQAVSVRFNGTPWAGVFIAIFAGLLLVGGTIGLLLHMLRTPPDRPARADLSPP